MAHHLCGLKRDTWSDSSIFGRKQATHLILFNFGKESTRASLLKVYGVSVPTLKNQMNHFLSYSWATKSMKHPVLTAWQDILEHSFEGLASMYHGACPLPTFMTLGSLRISTSFSLAKESHGTSSSLKFSNDAHGNFFVPNFNQDDY